MATKLDGKLPGKRVAFKPNGQPTRVTKKDDPKGTKKKG